jgi:hypothetical protein
MRRRARVWGELSIAAKAARAPAGDPAARARRKEGAHGLLARHGATSRTVKKLIY